MICHETYILTFQLQEKRCGRHTDSSVITMCITKWSLYWKRLLTMTELSTQRKKSKSNWNDLPMTNARKEWISLSSRLSIKVLFMNRLLSNCQILLNICKSRTDNQNQCSNFSVLIGMWKSFISPLYNKRKIRPSASCKCCFVFQITVYIVIL